MIVNGHYLVEMSSVLSNKCVNFISYGMSLIHLRTV